MRSTLVALTIITLKNPSISPPPRAEATFPPQWVKNSTVEISKSSVSSGMALDHLDKKNYSAIKIYTIAASEHAKTVEVPILKVVHGLAQSGGLPVP